MLLRSRGPLRAVHNQDVSLFTTDRTRLRSDSSSESLQFDTKDTSTPVFRSMAATDALRRKGSFGFSPPLRSSSYRSEKLHLLSSPDDIRQHFPLKLQPRHKPSENDPMDFSIVGNVIRSGKRPAPSSDEESTLPKQARHSVTPVSASMCCSSDFKPLNLTMGAYVKTHPRYFRRHSGTDFPKPLPTEPGLTAACSVNTLSPVCLVPMPDGFGSRVSDVGLSCTLSLADVTPNRVPHGNSSRTAETQTSPIVPSDGQTHLSSRKSRSSTTGSSHVLVGLRKTFGSLRRAISADRLLQRPCQSTLDPNANKSPLANAIKKSTFPRISTPNMKVRRSKRSSLRSTGSKRPSPGMAVKADPQVPIISKCELAEPPTIPRTVTAATDEPHQLTCQVIGTYADGSIRVVLRRSSTQHQFGFFIARDSNGIYISRLGSVRCAVKFWDVFHVGDRLLEVQGVSCAKLAVEDVRNLIRGCEWAEFRVKPARAVSSSLGCGR